MKKSEVILLAREFFKIRITSSREGLSQDDGKHKLKIGGITSYNHQVIEKWSKEAIEIAEIVIAVEEKYLNEEVKLSDQKIVVDTPDTRQAIAE